MKIVLMTTAFVALVAATMLPNCTGWILDYGRPAAQFEAADLASKGDQFKGRKITVRGMVTMVDTTDPESAKICLAHGILCDLGKFKGMAEGYKVGSVIYIDGILKRCNEDDCLLAPAIGRDPQASFVPAK
jgi:hypothetical protein